MTHEQRATALAEHYEGIYWGWFRSQGSAPASQEDRDATSRAAYVAAEIMLNRRKGESLDLLETFVNLERHGFGEFLCAGMVLLLADADNGAANDAVALNVL